MGKSERRIVEEGTQHSPDEFINFVAKIIAETMYRENQPDREKKPA